MFLNRFHNRIFFTLLAFFIISALGDVENEDENKNRESRILKHLFKFPLVNLRVVVPPEPPRVMRGCMLENGTMLYHGQAFPVFCDTWYCQDGTVIKPDLPMYETECPEDFVIKPDLGCIMKVDEETTWCDARRRCWAMGADLVSLDGNAELDENDPFDDFLSGTGKDWWVGLSRTNSDLWSWTIGGGQIQEESQIWAGGDPNFANQFACVRAIQSSYHLVDEPCDDSSQTHRFICEVPGFG